MGMFTRINISKREISVDRLHQVVRDKSNPQGGYSRYRSRSLAHCWSTARGSCEIPSPPSTQCFSDRVNLQQCLSKSAKLCFTTKPVLTFRILPGSGSSFYTVRQCKRRHKNNQRIQIFNLYLYIFRSSYIANN
jgi:hypothetical protein